MREEIDKATNRGLGVFEDIKRMNFFFIFGCRPSTGVKANTTMVKDIFDAFIQNADRINFEVLLPHVFSFMNAKDVSFETASSMKIKTIKLYHKHKVATLSIGLVFGHRLDASSSFSGKGNEVRLHKMLKLGLKLDRVHTYLDLCLSQLEEKITWVIEKTTGNPLSFAKIKRELALVVIINIGYMGFFLETEKEHKSEYDRINNRYKYRPQIFPKAIDSTCPFKNYMTIFDKHDDLKVRQNSMVDFSARISNLSQNILLILEVAHYMSNTYYRKKKTNANYQIPIDNLNERPGLQGITYSAIFDDANR